MFGKYKEENTHKRQNNGNQKFLLQRQTTILFRPTIQQETDIFNELIKVNIYNKLYNKLIYIYNTVHVNSYVYSFHHKDCEKLNVTEGHSLHIQHIIFI